MANDKRIFAGGGMDMDTEERLITSNDYRYALNCRVSSSDGANVGVLENVKSNGQLHALIEDEKYKVIGSYNEKTDNSLFYFVCDTVGSDHKIISNFSNGNWYVIAEGAYLNFNKNFFITGVNLIKDDIDYPDGILYWTDDFNEPRKLDVKRALYTTVSSTATPRYNVLNSDVIKSILPPPLFYPICNLGIDGGKLDVNYIKRHIWQFKYRWIYKNNGKSAWSPISDITMTRTGTPDRATFNLEEENCIDVRVNTGSDEVKHIEIAVRKYDFKEDFKLIKTIKKGNIYDDVYLSLQPIISGVSTDTIIDNDINIHYIFRNNELTTPLPLQETNRLFDDVPLLAKSQELIDGNRLTYGNIVNGYNPVETDVEFNTVYQNVQLQSRKTLQPLVTYSSRFFCDSYSNIWVGFRARQCYNIEIDFSNIDFTPGAIPAGADVDIEIEELAWGARYYRQGQSFLGITLCAEKWAEWLGYANIDNTSVQFQAGWGFSDLADWFKSTFNFRIQGVEKDYNGIELRMFDGCHNNGCNDGDSASSGSGSTNSAVDLTSSMNHTYTQTQSQHFCTIDYTNKKIKIDWIIENKDTLSSACSTIGVSNPQFAWEFDDRISWNIQNVDNIFDEITAPNPNIGENNSEITWLVGPIPENRGFKSGAEHGFGIVYYDKENRSTAVNKCPEAFVPFNLHRNSPQNPPSGVDIHGAPASIQFKINHQPPNWATHYQFVYSGVRSIDKFVQFHAKEFVVDAVFTSGYDTILPDSLEAVGSDGAGTFQSIIPSPTSTRVIKLNVGSLIQRKARSNLDDMMWTWQKGDRLRFVEYPGFVAGTTIIDFEIIGIDEDIDTTSKLWYVLDEQAYNELNLIVSQLEDTLIEVYRPNNTEEEMFYYEFGHMNPIENGNHMMTNKYDNEEYDIDYYNAPVGANPPALVNVDAQNQDFSLNKPAIGYFQFGDVHHRPREVFTATGYKVIEDSSFSDYFNSVGWGQGRPNAFLPDFKQTRRHSTIFYSEPYIPNTNINGLSTFYADVSFQEYDKRFNSIQKLYSINDALIIFQEDKVSRAMVSRDIIFDATGEQNVAISKNVLSPAIPYVGEYGICKNPESFSSFAFRSYFFDIKRGAVMRLSQDGLTPISEARMKNFFTDYCEEVMDNNRLKKFICYGAYDDKFDEYVISIPGMNWNTPVEANGQSIKKSISGFTIGFNEPSTRWNSFYSYKADWLESFNTGIVTFNNGIAWKHNANNVGYNTFYNIPYASIIDTVSNKSPDVTKIYNTISEESTDIWEAEISTRNGQNTDVTTQDFTNGQTFVWEEGHGTKENVHHSIIRGDLNSVGGKIEGDRIRDTSARVRLRLPIGPAQEENTLFSVKFGITPSGSPDLLGNV